MAELRWPSKRRRFLVEWPLPVSGVGRRYFLLRSSALRCAAAHPGAVVWVANGAGWSPRLGGV